MAVLLLVGGSTRATSGVTWTWQCLGATGQSVTVPKKEAGGVVSEVELRVSCMIGVYTILSSLFRYSCFKNNQLFKK